MYAGRKSKRVTDVTDGGDGNNVLMVSKQIQTLGDSSASRSVASTAQQQQTSVNKSLTHTDKTISSLYGWYCSISALF